MNNAKKIVETAKGMGLGKRARVIAIATAMQESNPTTSATPHTTCRWASPTTAGSADHDSSACSAAPVSRGSPGTS
jgi:hypothetical protein